MGFVAVVCPCAACGTIIHCNPIHVPSIRVNDEGPRLPICEGCADRLNEMLERVKSDKPLYNSDIKYIEKLSPTTEPNVEQVQQKPESIENKEIPINLEELRKSQPKPKPQKTKPIKFAVLRSENHNCEN